MGLDDGAADGEPHAEAVGLGGEEGVEDFFFLIGGDADAAVEDADEELAGGVELGAEDDFAEPEGGIGHGLHGVANEIDEDLLNLDGIALDTGECGGGLDAEADAAGDGLFAEEEGSFPEEGGDVVAAAGEALAAEEGAEAVEGFAGAGAVGEDALGGEESAVVVDLLAAEPTEAGVGVGDDGGEGLADLVRDGGGDLADAHHAGGVFEIFLGLVEAGLDEVVVFHVDEGAVPAGDGAVGVELGPGADEEAAVVAGGNLDAPLAVEGQARG